MRKPSLVFLFSAVVLLLGLVCAGATFASGAPPTALASRWGVFGFSSADGRETTEIEISSVLITNTADARPETTWIDQKIERVWVAKKWVMKTGAAATLQWTDSRTCYQLVETLATLIDLDKPADAPADAPAVRIDTSEVGGAVYRIEAAGLSLENRSGAVRLTNGAEATAGTLVRSALEAWRPCWTDAPPTLAARP